MNKWLIISEDETDDNGLPLFWNNKEGWVTIDKAQSFDKDKDNLPLGGEWTRDHMLHDLTYNSNGTISQKILGVDRDGNILIDPEINVEGVNTTFLFCEDCRMVVTGRELGASQYWEIV